MEKSTKVIVKDSVLCQAAEAGMDEFIKVFTDAIYDFIGGELCANNMGMLNSDQITLLAYVILRDTVMDGGFIELIHNGYGGFIFKNPFGKAVENGDFKTCIRSSENVIVYMLNIMKRLKKTARRKSLMRFMSSTLCLMILMMLLWRTKKTSHLPLPIILMSILITLQQ